MDGILIQTTTKDSSIIYLCTVLRLPLLEVPLGDIFIIVTYVYKNLIHTIYVNLLLRSVRLHFAKGTVTCNNLEREGTAC